MGQIHTYINCNAVTK